VHLRRFNKLTVLEKSMQLLERCSMIKANTLLVESTNKVFDKSRLKNIGHVELSK